MLNNLLMEASNVSRLYCKKLRIIILKLHLEKLDQILTVTTLFVVCSPDTYTYTYSLFYVAHT